MRTRLVAAADAEELELWRAGKLLAGTELAGKRVSVQIDGGRTRIRGKMRDGRHRSRRQRMPMVCRVKTSRAGRGNVPAGHSPPTGVNQNC